MDLIERKGPLPLWVVRDYIHSLTCHEPKHYRFYAEHEGLLVDLLEELGFQHVSSWKLQQCFKIGCRWGMILEMNTYYQAHLRCFGHLGRRFINCHVEGSIRYPSVHYRYEHDWHKGLKVIEELLPEFEKRVAWATRSGY